MNKRTYADPAISSRARHCRSFHLANVFLAINTGPASFAGCRYDRTSGRTDPTPPGDLDPRLDNYASRGRRSWDPLVQYGSMQGPSTSEGRSAYYGSSHPPVQHPASQYLSTLCPRTVDPGGGTTCRADLLELRPTT